MSKTAPFKGICTALVTPMNRDGSVDYISFKKLINFQLAAKIPALLFLGTTGEAPTISPTEKREIVKFAVKEVAGRAKIIIGIGGNNPADIIDFGKWLASLRGALATRQSRPAFSAPIDF